MNPLEQLRDIHLPDSIEWWPLAIGWWLLAGLLISGIALFWWRRKKSKHQRQLVSHALESLQRLEADQALSSQEWLQSLSALMRRIVINLHGRKAAAGLVGNQWLEYLDQHSSDKDFSQGAGRILAAQPYQQATHYDRTAISNLARKWVTSQSALSQGKLESNDA